MQQSNIWDEPNQKEPQQAARIVRSPDGTTACIDTHQAVSQRILELIMHELIMQHDHYLPGIVALTDKVNRTVRRHVVQNLTVETPVEGAQAPEQQGSAIEPFTFMLPSARGVEYAWC